MVNINLLITEEANLVDDSIKRMLSCSPVFSPLLALLIYFQMLDYRFNGNTEIQQGRL